MVVAAKNLKLHPIYSHGIGVDSLWRGKKSHTFDDFGMMPTEYDASEASIRRAAACSIALHSVCMVVAAKNLKLYPIYRHGIVVERQEKSHIR